MGSQEKRQNKKEVLNLKAENEIWEENKILWRDNVWVTGVTSL